MIHSVGVRVICFGMKRDCLLQILDMCHALRTFVAIRVLDIKRVRLFFLTLFPRHGTKSQGRSVHLVLIPLRCKSHATGDQLIKTKD